MRALLRIGQVDGIHDAACSPRSHEHSGHGRNDDGKQNETYEVGEGQSAITSSTRVSPFRPQV